MNTALDSYKIYIDKTVELKIPYKSQPYTLLAKRLKMYIR